MVWREWHEKFSILDSQSYIFLFPFIHSKVFHYFSFTSFLLIGFPLFLIYFFSPHWFSIISHLLLFSSWVFHYFSFTSFLLIGFPLFLSYFFSPHWFSIFFFLLYCFPFIYFLFVYHGYFVYLILYRYL
jgi:hypothetical protein